MNAWHCNLQFSKQDDIILTIMAKYTLTILTAALSAAAAINELVEMPGHDRPEQIISPQPHEYLTEDDLPKEHNWNDHNGMSCITHQLNQHIPQYCGSCWAHATASSVADRVKIARKCQGDDINLSIQYILNCGVLVAGSCHGGSSTGAYQFMSEKEIPFDTAMPYIACSSESKEGFCAHVDTTCTAINTARTCGTFSDKGGTCEALPSFPNVTIAEFGTIQEEDPIERVKKIKMEVFARGPVSASINAIPLKDFPGGKPFDDETAIGGPDHVVSIIGWGVEDGKEHWIVRNSWGSYWGEGGFFRILTGKNLLEIENGVSWATPKHWTTHNVACSEDGKTCGGEVVNHGKKVMHFIGEEYVDPSVEFIKKKEARESSSLRTSRT